MSPSSNPSRDSWTIEALSPDEKGTEFYLTRYKPFRLLSLQESPSAFGSTYERELAFTDSDWIQRVSNPIVKTFVAVDKSDGTVLSSVSLIGPIPIPDDPAVAERISALPPGLLHWTVTGVYTRPEARHKGISGNLLHHVWEWATQRSTVQGSSLIFTAEVMRTSHGARRLYEDFGFSELGEVDGRVRVMRCVEASSRRS